jgi:putative transposase
MLFSPNRRRKPGPKGPSAELVHAVVEMKQRNPRWGCPRIAEQIALAFNLPIDRRGAKDSRPSSLDRAPLVRHG